MTAPVAADNIGIIVLAAGSSTRFRGDKRLALLGDGRTLLETTLAGIPGTFGNKLLVLKPEDETLAARFSSQWQICFADNAAAGMANSLVAGIRAAAGWRGALIALGDMPFIRPDTYTAVRLALMQHAIVIPCYDNRRGNPVGFQQRYFSAISELKGDRGARVLLEKFREDCFLLDTGDEGILRDIDRPEMLI